MNKHIVGFILFNLIVGASVIIAVLSYQVPKLESVVVTPVTSETYTRSCWKGNKRYADKVTSAKITQAVFDSKTQKLNSSIIIQSNEKSFNYVNLALHFFVKDGDSTRYLATEDLTGEKMYMNGGLDFSERNLAKANFLMFTSIQWLDDLKSRENLYVVPEVISKANNYRNYTPAFDEANAAPVTLAR